MRFALPTVLFAATIFFVLGVTQPLLTVERLYFFDERPSLVAMTGTLASEGDWAIAGVIALFSLIFPAAKLLLLHIAAYGPATHALVPGTGQLVDDGRAAGRDRDLRRQDERPGGGGDPAGSLVLRGIGRADRGGVVAGKGPKLGNRGL